MTAIQKSHPESQRRFKRCAINSSVAVFHKSLFNYADGVELSEGGMLLRTNRFMKVGERVELNFQPHGNFVSLKAEVAYSLASGRAMLVGLKFVDMPSQFAEHIRNFIDVEGEGLTRERM